MLIHNLEKTFRKNTFQKYIEDTKVIRYKEMLFDNLLLLQSAVNMYKELGFYETGSYYDSSMAPSIYLKLDL